MFVWGVGISTEAGASLAFWKPAEALVQRTECGAAAVAAAAACSERRAGVGQRLEVRGALCVGMGGSFAKFVSKFAMLCIFPLREISSKLAMLCISPEPKSSRNSPLWRGKGIVRDRNGLRPEKK